MTGRFALAWAAGCLVPLASLAQSPPLPAAAVDHFEKKVRPLLLEQCGKCHGVDPKKVKGGLTLTTKAGLLAGGETGPAIVPGKPDESLLVRSVRYSDELKMPPKGRLKDHEVAALEEWVKAGAVWPDGGTAPAVTPPAPAGVPTFTAEQKAFWAFQPVRDPAPPAVRDAAWVASPVDAFILAKLEAKNLHPAPPADKRTLLRRVTFDLTGLPPTPDEVDTFLADPSPDAFAKVVDRLLASPTYGERWGRHWLDVARYADSNGLDENTAFGNAWKYRDYVIRAVNADKPFDVFVREQLAGDLLPPTDDPGLRADRLTALGYLAIGPKLLAEPDKQKMLLDIADEQLDTLGKGLMGLTLGCARCHDHKFDPLPTHDYYSLLGVFTSTRTMQGLGTVAKAFERPLTSDPPEAKAARETLTKLRKDLREQEKAFGKTPEADKAKRLEIHTLAEKLRAEIKQLEPKAPPPDNVLGVEEGTAAAYGTRPRNLYVQVRGNYSTAGEEAPAVFPRIVAGPTPTAFVSTAANPDDKPKANTTRFGAVRTGSGRLELANWLTDPAHPLTARVFVNRVWQHHFGEGIVRSPDNFGKLGERPTHPELLDWLAARFVRDGWSVKKLHRLIVLSNTYRTGPAFDPAAAAADPDNRLLWRHPRRRLEAEAVRDAMLTVAGNLDRTPGGSLLGGGNFEYVTNDQSANKARYDTPRRSVYLPVVRNAVFDFFQSFDFPDPCTMNGKRAVTVVAPQALFLMNSPFAARQADVFAARAQEAAGTDPAGRVAAIYRLALGRPPTADETARAARFVTAFVASLDGVEKNPAARERKAWAGLCQAVFASNEFVFID